MSVVGPRPFLVKDYVFFNKETLKRQLVKPGLTGLAQVNGRNGLSWDDKFKFDLEYCDNISFFNDVMLVIKTVFKAFIKKENIDRDGFATDEDDMATAEDFGDYLLRTRQISQSLYNQKVAKSKEMESDFCE